MPRSRSPRTRVSVHASGPIVENIEQNFLKYARTGFYMPPVFISLLWAVLFCPQEFEWVWPHVFSISCFTIVLTVASLIFDGGEHARQTKIVLIHAQVTLAFGVFLFFVAKAMHFFEFAGFVFSVLLKIVFPVLWFIEVIQRSKVMLQI